MSQARYAKRIDANQQALTKALRTVPGVSVWPVNDRCDLIVGYRGVNYLLEVKDPSKPPSARKLTDAEVKFHEGWQGQIAVVETFDDCLEVIGISP